LPTIESISELESDGKEADPKDDASLMESARILLDEIQINPRLAGL
jgi:carboxyl-terminal processing protease